MTTELWIELHERALSDQAHSNDLPPWVEGASDLPWIHKWIQKLPRYTTGCRCNEHWVKWYAVNPPVFTTRELYFEWTVRAHNSVNERLSKPVFTVDEARAYIERIMASRTVVAVVADTQ